MPMDIRNFFAQKGAGSGDKKKPSKSSNSSKAKAAKSSSSSNSHKAKATALSPIDEDGPVKRAPSQNNNNNNNKIIFDDSDSDATTDSPVDRKPAAAAARKAKATSGRPTKQLQEVSADDFFAASSPAAAAPKKPSPRKHKAAIDDDVIDLDDDDDELPLPSSKKRPSPQVAKNPPNKPVRKASPVKRQKLDQDSDDDDTDMGDNDKDNDDDKDDDDFVLDGKDSDDNGGDDEDDYLKEPAKKKSSPPKKRASSPAAKKAPPSSATKASSPPPSSKKRKTTPSSSSTVKKEPALAPSLEVPSFDTDKAVPECLQGHTFVFTGVLQGLPRDDAQDYVKILGGRVTTAVSSKTTYLVVGEELEDGRPYHEGKKYQRAIELGTHIVMGEKQLYGLAKLYSDQARASLPAVAGKENNTSSPAAEAKSGSSSKVPVVNPYASKPAVANNPYAKKAVTNPYAKKAVSNPYAKKASATSNTTAADSGYTPKPTQHGTNALWVDKHAPTNTRDVLGNKDLVNKLTSWLGRWESQFNNEQAIGKSFSNPKGPFKAALLSGPPGIGKTTTATLVAMEAGRDLLEFNASDVRSKKAMHEGMGDITGSQSVHGYFQLGGKEGKPNVGHHQKRCIIMDEVDGMGGGDRGGMAELIQMIKHSRVPIICICNDRQSQKMKSLLPYCLDLRFKRPMKGQIAKAAMKIAEREGLRVEQNAAEAMAESCGNDIRQVVNALQMWASDGKNKDDNSLTYKGLKDRQSSINKDEILRVGLFDAAKQILEGRRGLSEATPEAERASFFKRTDAFFVDYSFTGLLVQQNYLKVMIPQYNEAKRKSDAANSLEFLERMHSAAESMSDYAMVENKIRGGSDMNWGLLPFSGALVVKTGFHASGPTGTGYPGYPEFTTWLGKNSSKGKKTRILQELSHHMNYKVSGGTQEVRLSYVPFLRQRFLSQLKFSQDEDRNAVAIHLMDEYGLDRDDVFENLDEFKMDSKGPKMADIDSKAKAAFTREYNKGSHKSQALVEEQGAPKKSKRGGGSDAVDPDDPDAINDDAALEEEDDDDEEDLEKLKDAFKKKGRAKSASKKAPAKGKGKKK